MSNESGVVEQPTDSETGQRIIGVVLAVIIVALLVWGFSFLLSRRGGGSYGFAPWPLGG